MIRLWHLMAVLIFGLFVSGCASTGSVDEVRRDVEVAMTRIYSVEKDLASSREGEKSFKSDFASLRKTDADLQATMDSLRSDMQSVLGKMDDLGISARKPADELVRYREDADRRIVALEDRIVKLQAALDELNKRLKDPSGLAGVVPGVGERDDDLYVKALEAFKAADYQGARTQLTAFIEQHPNHELVPNARYWIGETFYSEKNYEQAILEFQEVIKKYPKKEKAPAAMFKQALAFKALKDVKSAKYLLKKLTDEYPKSEEARKAKPLLKSMK